MIDIMNSFEMSDYTFKNYVILTQEEKALVLEHRNKNRQWMLTQEEISLENHLKWIETLKDDKTKLYYLVYKDGNPFISISYHDMIGGKEAYWGYFIIDETFKSEVLKIEQAIIDFAFSNLNLDRLLCINDSQNHVIKIHEFFGFKKVGIEIHNNQEYTLMELTKESQ